jgi:hypothetical protein
MKWASRHSCGQDKDEKYKETSLRRQFTTRGQVTSSQMVGKKIENKGQKMKSVSVDNFSQWRNFRSLTVWSWTQMLKGGHKK